MLIRTQDKQGIYNLDNMQGITVVKMMKDNSINYTIEIYFTKDTYRLGRYRTQENALGILDNICKLYAFNKNGVFQMPEV